MVRECVSSQAHRKTDSFCKSFGGGQCHLNLSWYRYQEKGHSIVKYYGFVEPLGQRFELGRFRSPGKGKFLSLSLSSSYCLVGPVTPGQQTPLPRDTASHGKTCGAFGTGGLGTASPFPHTPTLRHWQLSSSGQFVQSRAQKESCGLSGPST